MAMSFKEKKSFTFFSLGSNSGLHSLFNVAAINDLANNDDLYI